MTRTEITISCVGAILVGASAFAFGRMHTQPPTKTPQAIVPVASVPGSAVPAPIMPPPVVMLPPVSQSPASQSQVSQIDQPTASQPPQTDASFLGGTEAEQRAKIAEMSRQRDADNRQLAIDGKPPMPDYQPTFRTEADGSIYHLENGTWRKMSEEEIKNPTPQEQAEANAGLAQGTADSKRLSAEGR